MIATTSENDADVCRAVAWLGEASVAVSGDAYIYRHELDPTFVAYFFQSDAFQAQKTRHITGTKVRRVNGAAMASVMIPVPPRQVQVEIASILGTMEQLKATLVEEMTARRRQLAYYRDALLTKRPASGPRHTTLAKITTQISSGRNKRRQTSGPYPVYGSTGLLGYTDKAAHSGQSLLVARVGANAGRVNAVQETSTSPTTPWS